MKVDLTDFRIQKYVMEFKSCRNNSVRKLLDKIRQKLIIKINWKIFSFITILKKLESLYNKEFLCSKWYFFFIILCSDKLILKFSEAHHQIQRS